MYWLLEEEEWGPFVKPLSVASRNLSESVTRLAVTDKPLTYSETVIFRQTSVCMHPLYIYYGLFWQGLRRHRGDTSNRSGIPTKCDLDA